MAAGRFDKIHIYVHNRCCGRELHTSVAMPSMSTRARIKTGRRRAWLAIVCPACALCTGMCVSACLSVVVLVVVSHICVPLPFRDRSHAQAGGLLWLMPCLPCPYSLRFVSLLHAAPGSGTLCQGDTMHFEYIAESSEWFSCWIRLDWVHGASCHSLAARGHVSGWFVPFGAELAEFTRGANCCCFSVVYGRGPWAAKATYP